MPQALTAVCLPLGRGCLAHCRWEKLPEADRAYIHEVPTHWAPSYSHHPRTGDCESPLPAALRRKRLPCVLLGHVWSRARGYIGAMGQAAASLACHTDDAMDCASSAPSGQAPGHARHQPDPQPKPNLLLCPPLVATPRPTPLAAAGYTGINKPVAMADWLAKTEVQEDYVLASPARRPCQA